MLVNLRLLDAYYNEQMIDIGENIEALLMVKSKYRTLLARVIKKDVSMVCGAKLVKCNI